MSSPARHRPGRISAAVDLITLVALTFALPPAGFVMAVRHAIRAARAGRRAGAMLFAMFALLSVITSVGLYAAVRGDHSLALLCETVAAVSVVGLVLRSLVDWPFRLIRGFDRRAS